MDKLINKIFSDLPNSESLSSIFEPQTDSMKFEIGKFLNNLKNGKIYIDENTIFDVNVYHQYERIKKTPNGVFVEKGVFNILCTNSDEYYTLISVDVKDTDINPELHVSKSRSYSFSFNVYAYTELFYIIRTFQQIKLIENYDPLKHIESLSFKISNDIRERECQHYLLKL